MNDRDKYPIFRRDGGRLIRIHGDVRDPNKRYSLVCAPEGSYLREFTPDEESARDEEEANWEEERPKRDAETKRKEDEFSEFRASLKYETRFVLFADILGWSSVVESSTHNLENAERLGLALNQLKQQASMVEWMNSNSGESGWPGDPQLSHFSDCVLASASADLEGRDWLISVLNFLSTTLLQQGFLLRGGLTIGPVYHTDSFVFGPALLRAYELEQSAIHPRVVLEKELFSVWGQGVKTVSKSGAVIGQAKTWRKSPDGMAFYDFLQPFPNFSDHEYSSAALERTYGPIKNFILQNLDLSINETRVLEKYQWLAEYFNEAIGEHPNNKVQRISLDAL